MTRVAAILPMRHNSERVPGKNYRDLGGRPLYHHVVESLLEVTTIDEIVVDTDSDFIINDVARAFPSVRVLIRPEHLRAGEIAMNDVLLNTIEQLDADVILQTHSTNPFLSPETIKDALAQFLSADRNFDSLFAVTRVQARLWSEDTKPINHDLAVLLRTQDLAPIYVENSCFYIFTPALIKELGSRIGRTPRMVEVQHLESLDIDVESDFQLAIAVEALRARNS